MGPVDYSDMVISTRLSDGGGEADNKDGNETIIIGLIMLSVSFPVAVLMGLSVWNNIGLILPSALIGLGFWASARYGTNVSLVARFRYRTTKSDRAKIERRLSGGFVDSEKIFK